MGPFLPQMGAAAVVDLDQTGAGEPGHFEPERQAPDPGADLKGAGRAAQVTPSRRSATDRR